MIKWGLCQKYKLFNPKINVFHMLISKKNHVISISTEKAFHRTTILDLAD